MDTIIIIASPSQARSKNKVISCMLKAWHTVQFSSGQFSYSVVSNSLRPHELQQGSVNINPCFSWQGRNLTSWQLMVESFLDNCDLEATCLFHCGVRNITRTGT